MADSQVRTALALLEASPLGKRLSAALVAYGELLEQPDLLTAVVELQAGRRPRHELRLTLKGAHRLVHDFGVVGCDDRGWLCLTTLGRDVCEVDDAQTDGAETLWGAGVHCARA